ncbi:hypothetical protein KSD_72970 [Ktedonobacter sp. SOSP1-85]|uniref:chitinase n=1 Tax=Ktedonobacter sp. SOSP1-85 TaxID=2778367 RepID=UPI001916B8E4|nr:chitinase [Ktedonobacter sp. SOSP1-85]GHO79526.1 hypothetical protein KSD_72970 [Ktedonobacter sp. SOSP1-85]
MGRNHKSRIWLIASLVSIIVVMASTIVIPPLLHSDRFALFTQHTTHAEQESRPSSLPAHVFAPYLEITTPHASLNLEALAEKTQSPYFTLGFLMDGGNCHAVWGTTGIAATTGFLRQEIEALRKGPVPGDVILAFGGGSDTELAQHCSESELEAQYQSVIDTYHAIAIDLDIEGDALLAHNDSIEERNHALAALQRNPRNKGVAISYTLPVGPYGLDDPTVPDEETFTQVKRLLTDARDQHLHLATVNFMTMDYGDYPLHRDMGQDAVRAATSVHALLQTLFFSETDPEAAQHAWAMLGITPMIGRNDVGDQIFTLDDARTLLAFGQEHHLARLSMWSLTRDRACANQAEFKHNKEIPDSQASTVCSDSVSPPWQQPSPYAFLMCFRAFTRV